MRPLLLLALFATPAAAAEPLAEKYLHSGQLALGEQALERELKARPKDDQVRFGLGLIRFVRGVERLGQSLYEYGAEADATGWLFVRLPVPKNPDPNAITYPKFRTVLDDFRRDLLAAEATLAGVTDPAVVLPLRLTPVKFDLDGDGKPTDSFADVLTRMLGVRPEFLKANPEFLVRFDRGDVAWLRAYAHLLAGTADLFLAIDLEQAFDQDYRRVFPKVKPAANPAAARPDWYWTIRVAEPVRLGRFREHLIQVAKLNRETWQFIRAETDNDHEWLPHAKQTSAIGLPVRDDMIDGWLKFVAELEGVLEGKKLIPISDYLNTDGKDLNLRTVLDDPPAVFHLAKIANGNIRATYLEKGPRADLDLLTGVGRVFDASLTGMYMAYFN